MTESTAARKNQTATNNMILQFVIGLLDDLQRLYCQDVTSGSDEVRSLL